LKEKIAEFFAARIPLRSIEAHFKKPLPKHINWLFSLGAMALFLLILQAATGAFLAIYYSPSPDHAYNSLNYISKEVPFGGFVRGLHHWGASAMVIVVFLHLLRVVVYDSYKSPRELTWFVGVLLLLIVLGFGFTGYLLPWDQKAYWATVVGAKIASTVPFIGDAIGRILRGGEEVGAVTLARFYAIHTIWLPWIAFGLVGLHLFFVRYLGSSGLPQNTSEDINAGKPFYPDQLFEDGVAILVLFSILVVMALFIPVPTEEIANPTDASYDPRPEWYFLFLFQLLKYFEGPLEVIGTFVIPTVAILFLFLVPFLSGKERLPLRKRPLALTITSISVLSLISLTILGIRSPRLNSNSTTVSEAEQSEAPSSADTEVFDFGLEEDN
jgi:ubiquinol-cytochrome c reductase cytochrome b subunit